MNSLLGILDPLCAMRTRALLIKPPYRYSKGLLTSRQLPSFNEVLVLVGGVKTRDAGVAAVRLMRTS